MTGDPVYVKLTRPEGYEDACEQIVIEDAEIHPGFMPEPATEEVERLRQEVDELKHDLERHMTHLNEMVNENERLRARGIEDMQFEIRQLRAAIAWALGYSSFR